MERELYLRMSKRYNELSKMGRGALIDLVQQNYKVIDTSEMDKYLALDYILTAEFGKHEVDEFYKDYSE